MTSTQTVAQLPQLVQKSYCPRAIRFYIILGQYKSYYPGTIRLYIVLGQYSFILSQDNTALYCPRAIRLVSPSQRGQYAFNTFFKSWSEREKKSPPEYTQLYSSVGMLKMYVYGTKIVFPPPHSTLPHFGPDSLGTAARTQCPPECDHVTC